MSTPNVVRAWKDRAYLESLSAEERALVPPNPVGEIALSDDDLAIIVGGLKSSQQPNTGTGSTNPPCRCTCFIASQPSL